MLTYISMLNWNGTPPPRRHDVRAAGLHSLAPQSADDESSARRLAESILPAATTRIESVRFDDDPTELARRHEVVCPPHRRDYLRAFLEAVGGG